MFRGSQWADKVHHFGMLIMAEVRFSPTWSDFSDFLDKTGCSHFPLTLDHDFEWPWNIYCWFGVSSSFIDIKYNFMAPFSLVWRPFPPNGSHVRRDTWSISKIRLREILYRSQISESLVISHLWSIFLDEKERKFGRISNFGRPVTLNSSLNDLETRKSLGGSHQPLSKSNIWL